MIDKLRVWTTRFKWVIFIFAVSLAGALGLFLRLGTSEGPQFYLRFVLSLAVAWAILLGIIWLLSRWIEFED
ncbi:MAG TPA: hypothetical protein VGD58_23870 [Herpetosiphonaceae bacterium]